VRRRVIITQARMTSTRLPGKVLREVLGKSLLEFHLERLRRVRRADEVVVATTTNATDDPIVDLCDRLHVSHFRGSEHDVLARFYGAAMEYSAAVIVRVTADCPLIDPAVVDRVIAEFAGKPCSVDYASNTIERTYPRGLDCEVFSFSALETAHVEAVAGPDREHVTPFLYHQPDRFRVKSVRAGRDYSRYRWTVDTAEDFALVTCILGRLYPEKENFTFEDCLELVESHPSLSEINANIAQKAYGE